MGSEEIILLDVGHGNSSVIHLEDDVTIIDAPSRSLLLETLVEIGVTKVRRVCISHGDRDHIGGISALLTSDHIVVEEVFVNPDVSKSVIPTSIWNGLRSALADASKKHGTKALGLTTDQPASIPLSSGYSLDVLWPTPPVVLGGVGGLNPAGTKKQTSNSTSAVLKLCKDEKGIALFCGDVDADGLEGMVEGGADLDAGLLVFPHHGGNPAGADASQFTKELCSQVLPTSVFFSNSRERFDNPKPDIVQTVATDTSATIFCSQLSKRCQADTSQLANGHLSELPSQGREKGHCCAGSVRLSLDGAICDDGEAFRDHQEFVGECVPGRLCARE